MNASRRSHRAATQWRSILRVDRLDAAAIEAGADALLLDGPAGSGPRPTTLILRTGATDDLDRAMTARPDALLLAECGSGADLAIFSARIAAAEALAGLPDGSVPLLASIETPEALLALDTIPRAARRVAGLVFDPVPLARRLGVASEDEPLRVARTLVLAAAAIAGVPAFDAGAGDGIGEKRAAGFAGMVTGDPSLVAAINDRFRR